MTSLSSELPSEHCQQGLRTRSLTEERLDERDSERQTMPNPTRRGRNHVLSTISDSAVHWKSSKSGERDVGSIARQEIDSPAQPDRSPSRRHENGTPSGRPATTDAVPYSMVKASNHLGNGQESGGQSQRNDADSQTSVHKLCDCASPRHLPTQGVPRVQNNRIQNGENLHALVLFPTVSN
jgi:hypothetical protein